MNTTRGRYTYLPPRTQARTYSDGLADERARIVEWLCDGDYRFVSSVTKALADAIERGDHRKDNA